MVVGANPVPTGILNLGCSVEGDFIQCRQLNYEAALGQGPLLLEGFALLHLLLSGPVHSAPPRYLCCFSSAGENSPPSLVERSGGALSQRGADWSDWSFLMQMRTLNRHHDWSNSTVLIGL